MNPASEGYQYVDITEEFITCAPPDKVILAPGFTLEDAVSSIDLMHPKMDRGMLTINGRDIWAHRRYMLEEVLPLSPLASTHPPKWLVCRFASKLWTLVSTWVAGNSAADTICTCMALYDRELIRCPTLRWMITANLQICLMMAEMTQQSYLVRNDEFLPLLFSLIDGREDPMGERASRWFNFNEEGIRIEFGDAVVAECRRLYLWIVLLRGLRTNHFHTYGDIQSILEQLDDTPPILGHRDDAPGRASMSTMDEECFICPLLANYFTNGCVRRPVAILDVEECDRAWKKLVNSLIEYVELVSTRSLSLVDLVNYHVQMKSDQEHRFGALLSSIILSLLLRQGNMIFNMLPLDDFTRQTLGLSGTDPWATDLVNNTIRVSLMSLARQRRTIPKLLRLFESYEGEGWETVTRLAWWWARWFVILGFRLELYEAYEIPEAHAALRLLAVQGSSLYALAEEQMKQSLLLAQRPNLPVYDDHRRRQRWGCLYFLLGQELKDALSHLDRVEAPSVPAHAAQLTHPAVDLQRIADRYHATFLT